MLRSDPRLEPRPRHRRPSSSSSRPSLPRAAQRVPAVPPAPQPTCCDHTSTGAQVPGGTGGRANTGDSPHTRGVSPPLPGRKAAPPRGVRGPRLCSHGPCWLRRGRTAALLRAPSDPPGSSRPLAAPSPDGSGSSCRCFCPRPLCSPRAPLAGRGAELPASGLPGHGAPSTSGPAPPPGDPAGAVSISTAAP